jgi:AraC-like DNA-binding protein
MFDRHQLANHHFRPLNIKPEYYKILTSMANAVCTTPELFTDSCSPILLSAFANVIYAAILSSVAHHPGLSPSRAALVADANAKIEQHYTDPRFDVAALVSELAVSRSLLHRAFAAAGSTPRRALEEVRVLAAAAYLESVPAPGVNTYAAAAAQAGFSSTRQMRQAMNRFGKPPVN